MNPEPRGMYFEDFKIGMKITTPARTITETDIINFAGLSGDFNALHTDAEFAKQTMFGKRIAHGLLVLSIASGLAARQGFIEGTTLAFRGLEWRFSAPVFIGDTIHMEAEVTELNPIPRLGGGQVLLKATVLNQDGAVVHKGEWNLLMKSKNA